MAKISLKCEQCGGNIVLDNSHEFGTCENCFSQFVIKQDQIVQKITQNITKYVYGYEGKDVEELLVDGYKLIELDDTERANMKFEQAINIEPDCWSAWLGYAFTGGDCSGYLSIVPAYQKAYQVAKSEKQELDTFVDMTCYLPNQQLRAAFLREFNLATRQRRYEIFRLVLGVLGCDESEIAALAIDLCPNDWRTHFEMAKIRKIRVRWCTLEGNFFTGKHLPSHAVEVLNIFMNAYRLAKMEGNDAENTIRSYVNSLCNDESYKVFGNELMTRIRCVG